MVRTAGFGAVETDAPLDDDDDDDDERAAAGVGVTAGVSPEVDSAANATADASAGDDAEPTRDTLMRRTPTAPPVAAADSVVDASSAGAGRLAAAAAVSVDPADDEEGDDAEEDEAAINVAVDALRCGAIHAAASLGKSAASVEKVRDIDVTLSALAAEFDFIAGAD